MEGLAGTMLVVWLLGLVLVIAWALLPFAMFGMKPLLRELIAETKRTNDLLEAARARAASAADVAS